MIQHFVSVLQLKHVAARLHEPWKIDQQHLKLDTVCIHHLLHSQLAILLLQRFEELGTVYAKLLPALKRLIG